MSSNGTYLALHIRSTIGVVLIIIMMGIAASPAARLGGLGPRRCPLFNGNSIVGSR